ncbi:MULTISPECIES: hypothetical protein [Enterobacteriaceae]|uniref:Uncharacterized protein n=2 Tax=Citrobacter freundii complex TaxID=1344959 RepID=A0AAN4IGQ1_CITFR|nr:MULTISPECIES: hypothetical protein [Enterobacteriaceae]EFT9271401.1 hypothetical protein [Salmonella enterica]EHN0306423.1 hypothetical protein [Salmonella enterica subsp. enterica serovar Schwarzengrund]EKO7010649.1 hypothetical protein [Escherichia coli]DAY52924.1 MAG TPA: Geopilin domain 1 protein, PilA, bacterial nanowire, type [Caudoviricetes sp.]EIM7003850.1 hypothetical protein [Salmonella enterica subsp. enterica serovar Schwarzengrund]
MKLEMAIGLFIFAVFVLSLIQILIRMHCKKINQKKDKALSEFRSRREEVERKARRQL